MLDTTYIRDTIQKAGISPTPVRILVYKILLGSQAPLSMAEMEESLETVDKSTISRTLTIFRRHHLIHAFNDGSGSWKFEICHSGYEIHDDMHVHFHCRKCGATICLTDVPVPKVSLPDGFLQDEINYVVSGICADCSVL